jgi:hypothetical protein
LVSLAVLTTALLGCSDDTSASNPDAPLDLPRDRSGDLSLDLAPVDDAGDSGDADLSIEDAPDDATDVAFDAVSDTAEEDQDREDSTTDASPSCEQAIAALAGELYEEIGACTVTVRLDYQTRDLISYAVICGSYATVSESEARSQAQADSGYGSVGSMLNEAEPDDYFVFYQAPGDFGGASAVSATTGLTTFGGSIIWMGIGEITHPTTWRDADELAGDCSTSGGFPDSRGWDLRGGGALEASDFSTVLDVVEQTAVTGAFWHGGYIFDAVVLLYPRSVGMFDPTTAEWIVMVSGGWLE